MYAVQYSRWQYARLRFFLNLPHRKTKVDEERLVSIHCSSKRLCAGPLSPLYYYVCFFILETDVLPSSYLTFTVCSHVCFGLNMKVEYYTEQHLLWAWFMCALAQVGSTLFTDSTPASMNCAQDQLLQHAWVHAYQMNWTMGSSMQRSLPGRRHPYSHPCH